MLNFSSTHGLVLAADFPCTGENLTTLEEPQKSMSNTWPLGCPTVFFQSTLPELTCSPVAGTFTVGDKRPSWKATPIPH